MFEHMPKARSDIAMNWPDRGKFIHCDRRLPVEEKLHCTFLLTLFDRLGGDSVTGSEDDSMLYWPGGTEISVGHRTVYNCAGNRTSPYQYHSPGHLSLVLSFLLAM
eukprot:768384-Hanusia_phi.AAC.1